MPEKKEFILELQAQTKGLRELEASLSKIGKSLEALSKKSVNIKTTVNGKSNTGGDQGFKNAFEQEFGLVKNVSQPLPNAVKKAIEKPYSQMAEWKKKARDAFAKQELAEIKEANRISRMLYENEYRAFAAEPRQRVSTGLSPKPRFKSMTVAEVTSAGGLETSLRVGKKGKTTASPETSYRGIAVSQGGGVSELANLRAQKEYNALVQRSLDYDFKRLEVASKIHALNKEIALSNFKTSRANAAVAEKAELDRRSANRKKVTSNYQYGQYFSMLDTVIPQVTAKTADVEKLNALREAIKLTKSPLGSLEEGLKNAGLRLKDIIIHSATVITVWSSLRAVMLGLTSSIKEGITYAIDLDRALTKSQQFFAKGADTGALRGNLGKEIIKLSKETGKSVSEIQSAFQAFATFGGSFEDSISGMNEAVKLSTVTFEDTKTVAELTAQAYILMGDSITEAITAQEKQALISTKLKKLMVDNNFTLGQFSESFKYFVSTANSANMTLDDTYALLATLNSSGVMGSRAGTQLRSGITSMLGNLPEVAKQLGIIIDLTKESPMEAFSLVLSRVKEILESGEQVKFTEVLDKVFGGSVRAGEGLKALVTMMDTYENNLRTVKTTDVFKEVTDNANQYKDVIEQLSTKLDRLNQTKSIIGRSFLKGFLAGSGADIKLNDLLDKILSFNEEEAEKFGEKAGKGFVSGLIKGAISLVGLKLGADFTAKFIAGATAVGGFSKLSSALFAELSKESLKGLAGRAVTSFGGVFSSLSKLVLPTIGGLAGGYLVMGILSALEAGVPRALEIMKRYAGNAENFKIAKRPKNPEKVFGSREYIELADRDRERREKEVESKLAPAKKMSVNALNMVNMFSDIKSANEQDALNARTAAAGLKYEWEQVAAKIKKSNESLKEYEDSINNVFSDSGKRNAGVVKAQDELNSSIKEQVSLYNAVVESNNKIRGINQAGLEIEQVRNALLGNDIEKIKAFYNSLDPVLRKEIDLVALSEKSLEVEKQKLEVIKSQAEEIRGISDEYKGMFKGELSSFIQGKSNPKDMLNNLMEGTRKINADQAAAGIMDSLGSTGFFNALGLSSAKFGDMFRTPTEKHISGMNDAFERHISGLDKVLNSPSPSTNQFANASFASSPTNVNTAGAFGGALAGAGLGIGAIAAMQNNKAGVATINASGIGSGGSSATNINRATFSNGGTKNKAGFWRTAMSIGSSAMQGFGMGGGNSAPAGKQNPVGQTYTQQHGWGASTTYTAGPTRYATVSGKQVPIGGGTYTRTGSTTVGGFSTAKGSMGGNMANAYNMGMSAYDLSQMYQIKGSGNPWAGSGRGSAAGYQIGKNFGPYGAIIGAIAGGVYGFWQGARRKHEEDSYTYVKRTADNVAVTNNKLDIVNRNLVAIKSAIETYILPESAYLSEKSNLESQFSINAARGFT